MNIVNAGNRFQIYGEDVKTYRHLPTGSYIINYDNMSGFSLSARPNLIVSEEKIYGTIEYKVKKALHSYYAINRNFGVLLSGQKGTGKSLFVRLLSNMAIQNNLPVLIVNMAVAGLADFISSIEQDCVVIFDEFEKTFAKRDSWNPQDEMLTLFDGIDGGHKLFIVTCNDLKNLSEYMLNRPGRFHYHFTINTPSETEIQEYMTDKLLPDYRNIIPDIVNLSGIVDMPYDFLRAIAFEVNQGYSLKEAMSDLNITRTDRTRFNLKAYTSNGLIYESWNVPIDLSSHESIWHSFSRYKDHQDNYPKDVSLEFIPAFVHLVGQEYIINEKIVQEPYYHEENDNIQDVTIDRIILTKIPEYGPTRFLV